MISNAPYGFRHLTPKEISDTWPSTRIPILAAVAPAGQPHQALLDGSFLLFTDGTIHTPLSGMSLSPEALQSALDILRMEWNRKRLNLCDVEILRQAEAVLRRIGAREIRLYYHERGASDTTTLCTWGTLEPRTEQGTLADAYQKLQKP